MTCYDLTSVLTTISAASASIVAILGGFIASKLISINGERNAVTSKLREINDEIAYRTKLLEDAQYENDEEDALDFIKENIEYLVERANLEDLYDENNSYRLEFERLRPFWDKAEGILLRFESASCGEDVNDDGVPVSIESEIREDDFSYEICRKISKYYTQQHLRKINPYMRVPYDLKDIKFNGQPRWYLKNIDTISEENNALGWLEQQKKHYEDEKIRLSNPKGMKIGLCIFILFSIFCIIMPLILAPFCTTVYENYITRKVLVLGMFVIGLSSIFVYLMWLFHWGTTDD